MAFSAVSRLANLRRHLDLTETVNKAAQVGSIKVKVASEVSEALSLGRAVVALESTIISHGMPYPQNLETAKEVERIVRENGAVPATIAILDGTPCVGLSIEELERLAILGTRAQKTARRDIAHVVACGGNGATTVSATMLFASMVHIPVFVTGGIGGVHRHSEQTMDISSDLTELGRTPVTVVCAGVKSILDIPRTLEYLETLGVCVAAYKTNEFPAFFTESSGCKVSCRVDTPEDCACLIEASIKLKLGTGILIAVPIPQEHSTSGQIIESAIQKAIKEAREKNITGNAETPFLLARVNELTGGASLAANIALVKNNALVGAKVTVALAQLRENCQSLKKEQGKNTTETEMGCNTSKAEPALENSMHHHHHDHAEFQKPKTLKQEVVLQIPGCKVHLMDEGEAIELAQGHFTIMKIMDQNVPLATAIKVGNSVQWPLTKDEPVVKVDALHYLFSLPVKDGGEPLSYGVTFPEQCYGNMGMLDSFLKDHSCFSGLARNKESDLNWEEFAPRVEDYNHFLARAIAGGTGQIVKGIFMCTNAYTNQVQKGGETILNTAAEKNNGGVVRERMNHRSDATKNNATNENLKRVRKLTNMTEKLTKSLLDGVGIMSGSMMTTVLKSQPGQAFLKMLPGEVLLASLDAVNRVFEAAEAAEKQTFSATSQAATRMVSNRFGEEAGEATEHVFATAGHAVNTAWNVSKIRKAINPASSANAAGALRNSAKN